MAIYNNEQDPNVTTWEQQQKQTFEFYLDKKVTQWYRETHYVEAETLEDAKRIMIENFADGNTDETFDHQSQIDDTWEEMTYKENGDNPTQELYYDTELLTDNSNN